MAIEKFVDEYGTDLNSFRVEVTEKTDDKNYVVSLYRNAKITQVGTPLDAEHLNALVTQIGNNAEALIRINEWCTNTFEKPAYVSTEIKLDNPRTEKNTFVQTYPEFNTLNIDELFKKFVQRFQEIESVIPAKQKSKTLFTGQTIIADPTKASGTIKETGITFTDTVLAGETIRIYIAPSSLTYFGYCAMQVDLVLQNSSNYSGDSIKITSGNSAVYRTHIDSAPIQYDIWAVATNKSTSDTGKTVNSVTIYVQNIGTWDSPVAVAQLAVYSIEKIYY